MDAGSARLLMQSLEIMIGQANIALRISHDYCDSEVHALVAKLCAGLVEEVDFTVRRKITEKFPELRTAGL